MSFLTFCLKAFLFSQAVFRRCWRSRIDWGRGSLIKVTELFITDLSREKLLERMHARLIISLNMLEKESSEERLSGILRSSSGPSLKSR